MGNQSSSSGDFGFRLRGVESLYDLSFQEASRYPGKRTNVYHHRVCDGELVCSPNYPVWFYVYNYSGCRSDFVIFDQQICRAVCTYVQSDEP